MHRANSVSDLFHFARIVNDVNKLGPQLVQGTQEIWDALPVARYLCLVLVLLQLVYYSFLAVMRGATGGSLLFALEFLAIIISAHVPWVLYKWDGLTLKTKRYVAESVEETMRCSF